MFTPKTGEDEPILTCAYFSIGLVQPPTRIFTYIYRKNQPSMDRYKYTSIGDFSRNIRWSREANLGWNHQLDMYIVGKNNETT